MPEVASILARVLESDEDEEILGKDMAIVPYFVGSRVRVTDGQYTGELGTVMGKSTINNERDFWIHLDGATENINDAILYPADRLEPANDFNYPPGLVFKIKTGKFAERKAYLIGIDQAGDIVVHPEGHPDDWFSVSLRQADLEPLSESEIEGDEDDVKAVAGYVTPEFRYIRNDERDSNKQTFVYAYGELIGTVSLDLSVLTSERPWLEPAQGWVVIYMPDKGYMWKRGFKSREEAAMAIWMDRIGMKKLREAEDDIDFKEVYDDEYPTFTFLILGHDTGHEQWGSGIWEVYVDGEELGYEHRLYIGEIERVLAADNLVLGWRIKSALWPDKAPNETFGESLDAARWLWGQRQRWRSTESKADSANVRRLVSNLIDETEDEEVDFKDIAFDTLGSAREALESAGFKIEQAERIKDEILLKFTWPAPNAVAYINGAKRAREAIAPFIPIRHRDAKVDRKLDNQNQMIARMFIRRPYEETPWLWQTKRVPNYYDQNIPPGDTQLVALSPGTYKILFNDKVVGEVQSDRGHETVERIRDEMAQLHKILPFHPQGWNAPGNAWGTGRAVEWWRKNRHKLGKTANDYYFDRGMLSAD